MLTYQIKEDDIRRRADVFVQRQTPQLSRSFIKKLAQEGRLSFQSKPIAASYKFKTLGQLELDYDLTILENQPILKLNIIFEDSDLIVLNKESGVIVHARGHHWQEASIASSLRHYCHWPKLSQLATDDDLRLGLVHRLDRATSGLLICAKNLKALQALQAQFAARQIVKTYLGIILAKPKLPQEALIDKPIGRNFNNPKCFKVTGSGKSAQTFFKIIARSSNFYLLEIKPLTGRTHQIRVHLASLDAPLLGDDFYQGQAAERLMLHAHKLRFRHPQDDREMQFTARRPQIFTKVLADDK